jgi:hypothetical protein
MFHTTAVVPEKVRLACPPVEADIAVNACSCARCDVVTPAGEVVYGVHLRSKPATPGGPTTPPATGPVDGAANGLPNGAVCLSLCAGCATKQLDANRALVQGWLREMGWTG